MPLINDGYAVQSTSYALMAYMNHEVGQTSDAKRERDSMMRWLQLMRNYFGAFASSQVGVFQMSIQVFSSPCQRQCELLASVVCRSLTFHILIFSSETPSAK